MGRLSRQRGLTGYELLLFLLLGGMVVVFAFKTVPLYYDHYILDDVITKFLVEENYSQMGNNEIRNKISQRLSINNVRSWDRKTLKITRDREEKRIFELDYEARVNLVSNIDVICSFKKVYEIP